MGWTPILLSSKLADESWRSVYAIAEAVVRHEYLPSIYRRPGDKCGEALLFGYLALSTNEGGAWVEQTESCSNAAIEDAESLAGSTALYGGLSGLGWTVEHLCRAFGQDEGSGIDLNGDIDSAILLQLARREWPGPYDLVYGLVGVGIYFLERLPCEAACRGIRLVMDHLEALSQWTDEGLTWLTRPELLSDAEREYFIGGNYNLGCAHGIPGILYLLNEVAVTSIDCRAADLLEHAMRWFIARKRPTGSLSWFSSFYSASVQSDDSRLGWCYGDLGILTVLLQIARRTGREDWREFAQNLLEHCLAWPPERAQVNDAPLCHGAAGVAHLFNRIYHTEGDVRCREASLKWFERALGMRRPGEGVGGFFARATRGLDARVVWDPNPAFLDGSIGIALALLAGLCPIEPRWDRLLLASGFGGG
jgi:hypothetical protein